MAFSPPEDLLLAGLIALYLLLGLGYWWWEPFGQGPDERPHWLFVQSLVEQRRLPVLSTDLQDPAFEAHQPPLYYLLAVPFYLLERLAGVEGKGVQLYSLLLGVVLLWLLHATLKEFWPQQKALRLFLVGFVGLLPMQVYLFSRVNNDPLVQVVWLLVWREWGRLLRDGPDLTRSAWLGLWLGAALLTKTSGLFLLPPTLFLLVHLLRTHRAEQRKQILLAGGITLGITILLAGWWFVRNRMLYGDFLAHQAFTDRFRDRVTPEGLMSALHLNWYGYWGFVGWWVYRSFWGVFGHMDRFMPPVIYGLLGTFPLLALLGGVRALVGRQPLKRAGLNYLGLLTLFTLSLLVLGLIQFNLAYFQAQARYLFPLLFGWGWLLWRGWERFFGEQRTPLVALSLATLLLLTHLVAFAAL